MATVIDTLFMELGIDSSKFSRQVDVTESDNNRLQKSFKDTEKASKEAAKAAKKEVDELKKEIKEAKKEREKEEKEAEKARKKQEAEEKKAEKEAADRKKKQIELLKKLAKGFASFGALVMGTSVFTKFIREATEANVQLDNLSRNIGMNRNQLQAWGGMAAMAGGNADAMKGSLAGLSMSITRLTTMGDTSMVPFFNAFGVALLNADGKARDLDSIMLDLADRFSKMDRVQAYNLAKSMGLDDGTINTLLLGRTEMEKMLEMQNRLYRSGEKERQLSNELMRARGYLNLQWEALKQMLADALAPHLLRLVKLVSSFADYLMRNENTMKHVFEGLAFVLGVVLIPVLWSAVTALYAFIAPFALAAAAVAALGAAFVLLYDDYKTWAEGGKSLFDWGAFTGYIRTSKVSVDSLTKGFTYLLTGYTSWAEAGKGLFDWLRLKGFIDENGVSVKSLATGFHNLYLEIKTYLMPYFEALGDLFASIMRGDWEGAKNAAGRALREAGKVITDTVSFGVERAAGALDYVTGRTPGAAGSAQAAVRSLGSGERVAKQMFSPGGTIYFGDSIADGYRSAVNGTGSTRVGANPQQVLGFINGYSGNLQGQTVILSSGMSNDPTDTDGIRAQIRALRARGANVRLLGVSNTYNRKGQTGARMNALLGQIAREEHATFQGGFQAGRDNIHPASYSSQPWLGGGSRQAASGQLHRSRAFTPEKAAAIARVARNIGVSPNDLAAVISFETRGTFSPSITNPTSSATGLIQFMAGSGGTRGQYYGMTRDQFRSLSFDQQMNYVERYFKERGFDGRRQRDVADLYTAVTGYGYRRGTRAYELNKVWDSNGDGYIAKGEMVQNRQFRAHQRQYFPDLNQPIGGQAVADNAQRGLQSMQQGAVARQQAQQITNNSNMQFAINGGIHVQSSASTIDGTMADASAAARNRLVQIMPAMV